MDDKPIEPWKFQPGNSKALTHGARSERVVLARAKVEYARLIDEHPQLQDFPDATLDYCVALSVWSLYTEAIDRLGVMDDRDEPRSSLSKQVRLWSSKAIEHRQRLGLSPTSQSWLRLNQATVEERQAQMIAAAEERLKILAPDHYAKLQAEKALGDDDDEEGS